MPGSVIFGVEVFKKTLEEVIRKKHISFMPFMSPVSIDASRQEITFKYFGKDEAVLQNLKEAGHKIPGDGTVVMHYDMLHLAPPQAAPDVVRNGPLAYSEGPNKGWMEVDVFTLQHPVYKNVFGLGDAAALPTAKTGAAIRKQVPVVVANVLSMIRNGKISDKKYEGYSSCPLVTGYGKMLLAEFKYNNVRDSDPLLTKMFDTTKELYSMWILKKYALPWLYWNKMMKGKM
jgi:sulfide:quinone oxidoreductase